MVSLCLIYIIYRNVQFICYIVFQQGTRLHPLNKYGNRAGSQTGHYLNAESMWPYQSGHGKQDIVDPRHHGGSVSGTDVRSGWMSRPQSVLGEDSEMYMHSPRDQELKPVKSGKTRTGYHELRGLRDGNTWGVHRDVTWWTEHCGVHLTIDMHVHVKKKHIVACYNKKIVYVYK